MEWKEGTPKFGDLVRTKVSFYHHYGIFADETKVIQFGLPDDPGRPSSEIKVLATDVYTFLQGGELEIGNPDSGERKKMRSAKEIVAAAEGRLGEGGYDLLHNNCEHFINQCAFGESSSSFVDKARKEIKQKLLNKSHNKVENPR